MSNKDATPKQKKSRAKKRAEQETEQTAGSSPTSETSAVVEEQQSATLMFSTGKARKQNEPRLVLKSLSCFSSRPLRQSIRDSIKENLDVLMSIKDVPKLKDKVIEIVRKTVFKKEGVLDLALENQFDLFTTKLREERMDKDLNRYYKKSQKTPMEEQVQQLDMKAPVSRGSSSSSPATPAITTFTITASNAPRADKSPPFSAAFPPPTTPPPTHPTHMLYRSMQPPPMNMSMHLPPPMYPPLPMWYPQPPSMYSNQFQLDPSMLGWGTFPPMPPALSPPPQTLPPLPPSPTLPRFINGLQPPAPRQPPPS